MLSGHSILGISFAAIIYIVCLTGSLSVFLRDFQRWEQPNAPVLLTASDVAIGRAAAAMGERLGPQETFYVGVPDSDFPRLMLSSGHDGETWLADGQGQLVVRQQAPWIEFVEELHTELHLPDTWGRFLVGLTGVALLSSLISGVLAHPRIFRDAFHLRLGGSRRLEQADLHNRLGVWPLPFHIIVTLTGALLGLSTIIVGVLAMLLFRGDTAKVYALLAPPPAAVDARPAPPPDVSKMIAEARARTTAAEPKQVIISHWGRRDFRMEVSARRSRLLAQQDSFTFDVSGRMVSEKHPDGLTVGEQILGSLGQLHFGWFGGVAVRIAYGLLGLALCVVTSSGINVWLARRRDKGRAAPGWERVWMAISWGQPVALLIPALIAVAATGWTTSSKLTLVWIFVSVAAVVGAGVARIEAARLAVIGRKMAGGTMVAIAICYIVLCSRSVTDTAAAIAVTTILLLVGAYLTFRRA